MEEFINDKAYIKIKIVMATKIGILKLLKYKKTRGRGRGVGDRMKS